MKKPDGSEWFYPLRVTQGDADTKFTKGLEPLPSGKSVLNYDEWAYYGNKQSTVTFNAKTSRVNSVSCAVGWINSTQMCDETFGVRSDMSEDDVVARLGKPDKEEISGGGTLEGVPVVVEKMLYYNDIGLHINLAQRKIESIHKNAVKGAGFAWFFRHDLF